MTPSRLVVPSVAAILVSAAAAAMVALASGGCSSSSGGSQDAGAKGHGDAPSAETGAMILDGPRHGPDAPPPTDEAGATSTCAAFAAYSMCNTTDLCAPMEAQDCDEFDALYSLTGRQAVTGCYGAPAACGLSAGPEGCLLTAALAAKPDALQQKLASDFCKACPSGASTCPADFYADMSPEAGAVGTGATLLFSLMNDATITQINQTCITGLSNDSGAGDGGLDCNDTFIQCAASLVTPTNCGLPGDGGSESGGP